ncbi:unnamed protein product [Boreogadus saida]
MRSLSPWRRAMGDHNVDGCDVVGPRWCARAAPPLRPTLTADWSTTATEDSEPSTPLTPSATLRLAAISFSVAFGSESPPSPAYQAIRRSDRESTFEEPGDSSQRCTGAHGASIASERDDGGMAFGVWPVSVNNKHFKPRADKLG